MTISIKFLKYMFAFTLFLTALAYTVFFTTDIDSAYNELPTTQNVYIVQTEIPQEVLWTGAQVVGKLYRLTEDNVPIIVSGVTFQTDKDVMDYQHIVNLNAMYKQDVKYNSNGEINQLIFTIQ